MSASTADVLYRPNRFLSDYMYHWRRSLCMHYRNHDLVYRAGQDIPPLDSDEWIEVNLE